MQNNKISLENTDRGVEYYNKEEQRITKDNLLVASPATMTKKNDFLSSSSGLAPASLSHQAVAFAEVNLGVPDETIVVASEEGFTLNESMIERAPIQLWDNGESAFRRYKLKVRLNLVDDKENPEFIASLTKDFRNFKKYIPAECKDHIVEKAGEIRKAIKAKHGSFPYIGKFHLSTSYVDGKRSKAQNQIEPWTFAAVWWDPEERGWSGVLCIHDWVYEFDLFEDNLTVKQKSAGCKAATLYINPQHDKRVRPKTWAQRRSEK
jgi:hypothetical protein